MPVYYGTTSTTEMNETGNKDVKVHFWKPLLVLTFLYYVISCGIERIYQPMVIHSHLPSFPPKLYFYKFVIVNLDHPIIDTYTEPSLLPPKQF